MGAGGALLVEPCCSGLVAVFDTHSVLSSDFGVCDDEAGIAFDGFLKTTMVGMQSVGV
jgi:hypothetical protein